MYIVIAGGGKVGFFLSKELYEAGHEVLVIEKLERRYQLIAEDLGELAMLGDGCDVRTLELAGVGRADVVVAATGDDEDNLVIAQLAKTKFKVRRTVARVNNPKNEEVFKLLGIDDTVSATRILQSLIEYELDVDAMIPLRSVSSGQFELSELHVLPGAPAVGKKVRELQLPGGALLAVVLRDGTASLVHGDTEIRAQDTLIAFTRAGEAEALRKAIVGPTPAR